MKRMETALAEYLFHQGTNEHAYTYLGAHRLPTSDEAPGAGETFVFRTWAPHADEVALVADFTDWDTGVPLRRVSEGGVWELIFTTHGSAVGQKYKFRIRNGDRVFLKGDPYAFRSEGGAGGASILTEDSDYPFHDGEWMEYRRRTVCTRDGAYLSAPLNIYELHAASFARHEDGRYFTYRELADTLISYVRYMGYTHVEFMPLCEYPYDGSWGYQVGAYYAPTGRFGGPDDLAYLVDRLHGAGIGVLMDWVPAHFPKDCWGLYEFDGAPLYEYEAPDRREAEGWGTRYFDLGRPEVRCFLISNALYWMRRFHFDGLRVDAVASMLYRDYDRAPGTWRPNEWGGIENLEAIGFFRRLNTAVFAEFPDALMVAEESTAFPGVTRPVDEGGLGFNLKWNMGFANDFFAYLHTEPIYRRYHHAALTFPMMYAYSEQFILPVSHDEVVYGKGSLLSKISGNRQEQIETLRAALCFLMTFPGKKLMFMGGEFGAVSEWDYRRALDFSLLRDPAHAALRDFTAALNHFYLDHPALWDLDFSPDGFVWLDVDDADDDLVAYRRRDRQGNELIVAVSFNGIDRFDYRLPLPDGGVYDVVFFSGAWADAYEKSFRAEQDERGHYLMMRLPARTAVILCRREDAVCVTISSEKP